MNAPTRRDVLKLLGGSLAGIFFTPLPWKLLDDTAIMTQTGPWIAKLPRGPLSVRYSTCTLCPAGCGIRARSVDGVPFSLSAVASHPLSYGTLCAAGLAAHHSAYHPLRVRTPLTISHDQPKSSVKAITLDEAKSQLRLVLSGIGAGKIALLDMQPGRTASLGYRKLLASRTNAHYLISGRGSAYTLDGMCESPFGPTGVDLEHAKLIVSLGAPLLEGWGYPNRLLSLPIEGRPAIIQVETRHSRTAALAHEWLPIKPGSESAFALGLAHAMIHSGTFDLSAFRRIALDGRSYLDLINQYSPKRTAELTGIRPERIVALACEIGAKSPAAVVIGPEAECGANDADDIAIMGLNLLIGNVGKEGGIFPRSEVPVQSELAEPELAPICTLTEIPDHSIELLLIDDPGTTASLDWEVIERKLSRERSFVVSFSPYLSGIARRADLLIPTPAPLESFADVTTPPFAVKASFAIAAPLLIPPDGVSDPLEILGNLFSMPTTTEHYLRARVEAIRKRGEGIVFSYNDASTQDAKSFGLADEFWSKLVAGGLWLGSPGVSRPIHGVSLLGRGNRKVHQLAAGATRSEPQADSSESFPLTLMPFRYPVGGAIAQVSPLMTKVFQESGLRSTSDTAVIDPVSATTFGFDDGDLAYLETVRGSRKMRITIDRSAMPGVIHASVGPDPIAFTSEGIELEQNILSLVELDDAGSWKPTPATLRKA